LCTIIPDSIGLTIPGIVANVLEIPNIILAYWGAMSRGLILGIQKKSYYKILIK